MNPFNCLKNGKRKRKKKPNGQITFKSNIACDPNDLDDLKYFMMLNFDANDVFFNTMNTPISKLNIFIARVIRS